MIIVYCEFKGRRHINSIHLRESVNGGGVWLRWEGQWGIRQEAGWAGKQSFRKEKSTSQSSSIQGWGMGSSLPWAQIIRGYTNCSYCKNFNKFSFFFSCYPHASTILKLSMTKIHWKNYFISLISKQCMFMVDFEWYRQVSKSHTFVMDSFINTGFHTEFWKTYKHTTNP